MVLPVKPCIVDALILRDIRSAAVLAKTDDRVARRHHPLPTVLPFVE